MTPELDSIAAQVREIVSAAGIDNFHMDKDILVMCGVRYLVEKCGCNDVACHGLHLRREDGLDGRQSVAMQ